MTPDWTSVAMFWATVGLVAVTLFATTLNYWLLRSQHDPHVVVYAADDRERPSVIVLVIKNVGRGMAYQVRFTASRPIPWKAWGMEPDNVRGAPFMTEGPLVSGIPALAPGETRVINWGQYWGLRAALSGTPIRVTATYESRGVIPLNPTDHVTESTIEVESFAGTVAHETTLAGIRDELKRIREDVAQLVGGFKTLRVSAEIRDDGKAGMVDRTADSIRLPPALPSAAPETPGKSRSE